MHTNIPSYEEYKELLSAPASPVDPTLESAEGVALSAAAKSLKGLDHFTVETLDAWLAKHPTAISVRALALAVGLTQEKMNASFKRDLKTIGLLTLARTRSKELIEYMNDQFNLAKLLEVQFNRDYDFGDILVTRAGSRAFAVRAGEAGRKLEDHIEDVAKSLGVQYQLRTKFVGRNGLEAPCDLAIPAGLDQAQIVVAAKNFDSGGSKLSDTVREVADMAAVRKPTQFVFAVIDGNGWLQRESDLRRLYEMWKTGQIDGMYTLATLGQFQEDLAEAVKMRGIPSTSVP